ncbi:hypothetical protein AC579_3561 [Pseudocercospora musae]|uniref:Uncharacterized protein n=1 Tax=Pseudocercospora musae TaxID=113226 RepID=A0A139IW19_9PEZI|nr:hypothetical protein AC579_3561 [Pseudocercospora musae]
MNDVPVTSGTLFKSRMRRRKRQMMMREHSLGDAEPGSTGAAVSFENILATDNIPILRRVYMFLCNHHNV